VTGRGRHIVVDTEGWLLALVVTAASVSDKAGAKLLLIRLFDAFSTLKLMWADTGYNGNPLAKYAQAVAAITVEVVARASPHSFQVVRRRWVVERTFGWLMRYRRLARDYERRPEHHEAMIYWATVFIMTKRLARYENGHPDPPRWGGERSRPAQQAALSAGS
jgi:transposase